ncbi:putative integral membrane protein pth11-like protein [Neofusicoccum parvum UCRNP2]|uniref:Putative integral membrane protein pth11-like protein n=1 Tax=Botryosphaeria parva (strain UCR-NP2) TaxID=1287680 RepID=R1GIS3_BOTPV|nr:putative integral membrane protein pth11-like protein [Neofusicoccum parvum UCRNP2]
MAPNDYGPSILVTAFTLTSLSTIIVSLRLYCNVHLLKRAGISDVFMSGAMIMTWGIAVINHYQVKYGTGKHYYDLGTGMGALEGTLKSWYSFQIAYLVDLLFVKFSILCFYCAICDQKWFRTVIYCMMGIVGSFTIAMAFVNAFECPNPSDAFTVEIIMAGLGSCRDLHSIVGFIAVLASVLRLWTLSIWARSKDVPYSGGPILIWTQIELNAAIISASFPAMKALFAHTFSEGTLTGQSSSGARYFKYGYGANSADKNKGIKVKDSTISLKTLSFVKSGSGETRTSATLPRGVHGMRSFDTGHHSDEQMFFDDPAGEDHVVESGKNSSDDRRDRITGLRPMSPIFPTHQGIMKSLTVEQTTESGTGQQYYRSHYLR